jgi:hypothetical protein
MAGMTKDTTNAGSMLWLAALAAAAVLLGPGCKKATPVAATDAGDAAEAGPTASVGETIAAAVALASNQADVTRYADEKPTPGSTLTTESSAELRTDIGTGGKLVVVLKKGTEVSKLTERADHYLVVSEDPKDPTRKLMGWASDSAFGGTGGGFHAAPAAVHPSDAGVDRGDAGAKVPSTDAGSSPAPISPGFSCVKQQGGKCPAAFVVSEAVCRLRCTTANECKGPEPKCKDGVCYASNGCGP